MVANSILIVTCSVGSWGQPQTVTAPVIGVQEFPVVFQSSVTAGKTPVGTKIQAKLSIATLLNGTVVPRNARFSGEIVVSQARTKNQPSLLGVRMNSVSWKNGSAPVKVFLTFWFYPSMAESLQNSQSGPVVWNSNPDPASGEYEPSPPDVPNTPTSQHREKMKDVDSERTGDETFTLICKQHNLKLDRSTTYVLGSSR